MPRSRGDIHRKHMLHVNRHREMRGGFSESELQNMVAQAGGPGTQAVTRELADQLRDPNSPLSTVVSNIPVIGRALSIAQHVAPLILQAFGAPTGVTNTDGRVPAHLLTPYYASTPEQLAQWKADLAAEPPGGRAQVMEYRPMGPPPRDLDAERRVGMNNKMDEWRNIVPSLSAAEILRRQHSQYDEDVKSLISDELPGSKKAISSEINERDKLLKSQGFPPMALVDNTLGNLLKKSFSTPRACPPGIYCGSFKSETSNVPLSPVIDQVANSTEKQRLQGIADGLEIGRIKSFLGKDAKTNEFAARDKSLILQGLPPLADTMIIAQNKLVHDIWAAANDRRLQGLPPLDDTMLTKKIEDDIWAAANDRRLTGLPPLDDTLEHAWAKAAVAKVKSIIGGRGGMNPVFQPIVFDPNLGPVQQNAWGMPMGVLHNNNNAWMPNRRILVEKGNPRQRRKRKVTGVPDPQPLAGGGGHASVFALTCIDPRFGDDVVNFLENSGLHENYDIFTLAGASLGAEQKGWQKTFFDTLDLGIKLHGIHEVWCFDHMDCGMYQAIYGSDTRAEHISCLNRFKQIIKKKYPQLGIREFIIGTNDTIEEIKGGMNPEEYKRWSESISNVPRPPRTPAQERIDRMRDEHMAEQNPPEHKQTRKAREKYEDELNRIEMKRIMEEEAYIKQADRVRHLRANPHSW